MAHIRNHIVFLKHCNKLGLIPKGVSLKSPIQSSIIAKILKKASHQIVKEMKNIQYSKLKKIEEAIQINGKFVTRTCPSYKRSILRFMDDSYTRKFDEIKKTQIKKLQQMTKKTMEQLTNPGDNIPHLPQFIKNISSKQLTTTEENILSLGMNYAIPKKSRVKENIETIMQVDRGLERAEELTDEEKNNIRREVANVLSNHPWHIDEQQKFHLVIKTIRDLQSYKNIMIVKADKGNTTVIMNVDDYDVKINSMLEQFPYKKLQRDPTPSYQREVNATLKNLLYANKISKDLWHALKPTDSKCPNFNGAPKIHKENYPLRPIVDFRHSPSYKLASYLNKVLKCVTMKGKYVTQNAADFVSKMKNVRMKRNYTPVSFDVVSLFTKVPIQITLIYMKEKLMEDTNWKVNTQLELQDIIMLTELCLKGNFFQYKNVLYEQLEGAAMGSPISPIFAEFFMQKLEETLVPKFGLSLYAWSRYVDDSL